MKQIHSINNTLINLLIKMENQLWYDDHAAESKRERKKDKLRFKVIQIVIPSICKGKECMLSTSFQNDIEMLWK